MAAELAVSRAALQRVAVLLFLPLHGEQTEFSAAFPRGCAAAAARGGRWGREHR